jgi:hypothetical protein
MILGKSGAFNPPEMPKDTDSLSRKEEYNFLKLMYDASLSVLAHDLPNLKEIELFNLKDTDRIGSHLNEEGRLKLLIETYGIDTDSYGRGIRCANVAPSFIDQIFNLLTLRALYPKRPLIPDKQDITWHE